MKAIVQDRYGSAEVLESRDIEKPQIGDIDVQQGKPSVKFQNRADLQVLRELVEAGKVTPVIDRTYPFSRAPQAIGRVGEGHARGTVVITV
jgi:NADPH:quinone reductase-like Zn-dependent oxidoreductase